MPLTPESLIQAAKIRIRERLTHRSRLDLGPPRRARTRITQRANAVVEQIASLIGVDASQLQPEDHLREILRVSQAELPQDVQALMPQFGLSGVIDPSAFDLLDFVEKSVAGDRSKLNRFRPMPRDDSEWLERILDMTLSELAEALA
jgi:hypothetical protein